MILKLKEIREQFNCKYTASISTNGYLLDDFFIKDNFIENIQMTIDGDEEFHNQTRILHNGEGTYKRVFNNLILILKKLSDQLYKVIVANVFIYVYGRV